MGNVGSRVFGKRRRISGMKKLIKNERWISLIWWQRAKEFRMRCHSETTYSFLFRRDFWFCSTGRNKMSLTGAQPQWMQQHLMNNLFLLLLKNKPKCWKMKTRFCFNKRFKCKIVVRFSSRIQSNITTVIIWLYIWRLNSNYTVASAA